MLFNKLIKRIKRKNIDIPQDLRLELKTLQDKKQNEDTFRYSLDDTFIDEAVKEIKEVELTPSFKEMLLHYIDKSGLKDSDVYKKAGVDRRTFSKIINQTNNYVSKNTAIRLGLALELPLKDFEKLLKANYSYLTTNDYKDIAIRYCIKKSIYNIDDVNDILYACDLSLL